MKMSTRILSFILISIVFVFISLSIVASSDKVNASCGDVWGSQCLDATGTQIPGASSCWYGLLPNQIRANCCTSESECAQICDRYNNYYDPDINCTPPGDNQPPPASTSCVGTYGQSSADSGNLVTGSTGSCCLDISRKAIDPFKSCVGSLTKVCVSQGNSCPTLYSCNIATDTCYPDPNGTSLSSNCCLGIAAPTSAPKANGGIWCERDKTINTAIGCIPILSQTDLVAFLLRWATGIGGGVAFLLMLYAGFMIMTASGNPDRIKAGQELLTSAIAGLLLIVFSIVVLKFIGVDILGLCKFGFGTCT